MLWLGHVTRGSHDLTDIDHDYTLAESSSNHSPVEGPVYVKDSLAVCILLVLSLSHLARGIVKGLHELLVFERPDVDILVLSTNCQE